MLFALVLLVIAACAQGSPLVNVISTLSTAGWTGAPVVIGPPSPSGSSSSVCWKSPNNNPSYIQAPTTVSNWSMASTLTFWLYLSSTDDNLYNNPSNGIGFYLGSGQYSYYYQFFKLKHPGWAAYSIHLSRFWATTNDGKPTMAQIDWIKFKTGSWGLSPIGNPDICLDRVSIGPNMAFFQTLDINYNMPLNYISQFPIQVSNPYLTGAYTVLTRTPLPTGLQISFAQTDVPNAPSSATLPTTISKGAVFQSLQMRVQTGSNLPIDGSHLIDIWLVSNSDTSTPVSTFSLNVTYRTKSSAPPPGKTRPFLLLSYTDKATLLSTPWKAPYIAQQLVISSNASTAATALPIPRAWGGWNAMWISPSGHQLLYNPNNSTHFYVPDEHVYLTGEPYASCWVAITHTNLIQNMVDMGVGYLLTGNRAYANQVIGMLMTYAEIYPALPWRDSKNAINLGGGHLSSGTMGEAMLITPLVMAFDLVAELMTDTQIMFVEWNLFRAACDVIIRNNMKLINWSIFHNTAMLLISYEFNDLYWRSVAMNQTYCGFNTLLSQGVLDDGLWWEGAMNYQYIVIDGLQPAILASYRMGEPLTAIKANRLDGMGTKTWESLFYAPIGMLMYVNQNYYPYAVGLQIPALNDDGTGGTLITDMVSQYELANFLYGPGSAKPSVHAAEYSYIMSQINDMLNITKRSRAPSDIIFWGAPIVPAAGFTLRSTTYSGVGYSILRSSNVPTDSYSNDFVLVKHGPFANHGHYDKLAITMSHNGTLLLQQSTQPGTYALPSHQNYDLRSLSSNTIMVDAISQLPAGGNQLLFGTEMNDLLVVSANTTSIYANNMTAQRSLIMLPFFDDLGRSVTIDLLEATPSKTDTSPHDYYSVLHSYGTFQVMENGPGMVPVSSYPWSSADVQWKYIDVLKMANRSTTGRLRYKFFQARAQFNDYFEDIDNWFDPKDGTHGVTLITGSPGSQLIFDGLGSMMWKDHAAHPNIVRQSYRDYTRAMGTSFWIFNSVMNNATIAVVYSFAVGANYKTMIDLPDKASYSIVLNWKGWKQFDVLFSSFKVNGSVRWNAIQYIYLSANYNGAIPQANSQLYIDHWITYDYKKVILAGDVTGLEVITDDKMPAMQLHTALAPNSPYSSWQPCSLTVLPASSKSSLFAQLLISPPLPNGANMGFTSNNVPGALTSTYQITYPTKNVSVVIYHPESDRRVSSIEGVKVITSRVGAPAYGAYWSAQGYNVDFLTQGNIKLQAKIADTLITGKLLNGVTNVNNGTVIASLYRNTPGYVSFYLGPVPGSTTSVIASVLLDNQPVAASSLLISFSIDRFATISIPINGDGGRHIIQVVSVSA